MDHMASPMKSFFLAISGTFHIQAGLATVEVQRSRRDDVGRHGHARRRPVPRALCLGQGVSLRKKALDAVRSELRSGQRGALQRVAEGRREVDATVEVSGLIEDRQRELEGERQAGGHGALSSDVVELVDVIDALEEGTEVALADVAESTRLRWSGLSLHRGEQLGHRILILLEVREVAEPWQVRAHSFRLLRAREACELPHELAQGEVSTTAPGVGYVAKNQHLEGFRTVPVRARRLARDVLLE